MTPESARAFAEYHRQGRSEAALRMIAVGATLLGALVLVVALGNAAPPAVGSTEADGIPAPTSAPNASPSPSASTTPEAPVLASPATDVVTAVTPAPVNAGPWQIDVDASGGQAQLDACLWVRMDFGAVAPIVGAHTSCGGSIILRMALGDAVTVTGQDLDGVYVVTEDRQAHAGDVAATATEGMDADVILQTCYPGADGRLRLVALRLAEA